MTLEDKTPEELSFRSRREAWDWVDQNHPGHTIRCYDNWDGTATVFLEEPPQVENVEEQQCCDVCNETPCVLVEHQEQFESLLEFYRSNQELANRQRRFKMYQEMTRLIHGGYLGKNNRKELPTCITEAIRNAFPNDDPEQAYVGFREAKTTV